MRMLDWNDGVETPLPGAERLFADYVVARSGWTALCYDMRATALPDPVSAETARGLPGRHPVSHQDHALLWLTDDAGVATPTDRFGRAAGASIAARSGWLTAAHDGAWLQWDPQIGVTTYRSRDGLTRSLGRVLNVAVAGPRVLLLSSPDANEASVFDLRDGSARAVPRGAFARWDRLASVSPDGTKVALSAQVEAPPEIPREELTREEWLRARADAAARYAGRFEAHLMTIVDLRDGSCAVASGTFRNVASRAAWTADARAIAFDIPYEPPTTLGWVALQDMTLSLRRFARRTGSPLLDMHGRLVA